MTEEINDDVELIQLELTENLENTISNLKQKLSKINIGRAQSDIFDLIRVDYYGHMTALPHMSIISVLDFNKVSIEPHEKSYLKIIEKAISNCGIDINPQIQGNVINVFFPQMTLEKRDKLIKLAKQYGEKAKIAIRNHRRTALDGIAELKLGEDISKSYNRDIELWIKKYVDMVEDLVSSKNKKLMELR